MSNSSEILSIFILGVVFLLLSYLSSVLLPPLAIFAFIFGVGCIVLAVLFLVVVIHEKLSEKIETWLG